MYPKQLVTPSVVPLTRLLFLTERHQNQQRKREGEQQHALIPVHQYLQQQQYNINNVSMPNGSFSPVTETTFSSSFPSTQYRAQPSTSREGEEIGDGSGSGSDKQEMPTHT